MLNISDRYRELIVAEFRYAAERMRAAPDPGDKLYFFSATYGMAQRVFNIEFDAELVHVYQLLNLAQNQMGGRLASQTPVMNITTPAILKLLEDAIEEMASRWERREEIGDLLERLALIAYSATGNGNYLVEKTLLPLEAS